MTLPLTSFDPDPILDLEPWVGQRAATYRFALVDGLTGGPLGDLHPIRGARLSHDTSRTIKRQLSLQLGAADTAAMNPLTDRVDVYMVLSDGREFPLGRYMYTDAARAVYTAGELSANALNDEMFLVDQEVEAGVNASGILVEAAIQDILAPLPVDFTLEASPYKSAESWGVGTTRGRMLESLALSGDYFSPWFGNDGLLHFIRAFDPATQVPDFNFDAGNRVLRDGIIRTDDLLTAPNRFVVVSNAADNPDTPVVGVADIPVTAPHSFANRGFVVQQTVTLQLSTTLQAQATAQNLALRQLVFEQVTLTTAPDPRHDSYNVIRWQGDLWLELAWSMELADGGSMTHSMRKAYR